MQNLFSALITLVLLFHVFAVSAQFQPTSLPHVFTYTTQFPLLSGVNKYNYERSTVISDSLIGIFHFGSASEVPDTLRIENIYTLQVVDRVVMPVFGDFEIVHATRTGNDLFLFPKSGSLIYITGDVAERWAKKRNINQREFPLCYRYNRVSKVITAFTINTKEFRSLSDYVMFSVNDIGFNADTYSLYLVNEANRLTLRFNLKNGESSILKAQDQIPDVIRQGYPSERKPKVKVNDLDLMMRGKAVIKDDRDLTIDTLHFTQRVEQKLIFKNMTLLLLNRETKADLSFSIGKSFRFKPAASTVTTQNKSETATEFKSFPYSQNTFSQWLLRYQKDRDDLFRGYDIFLNCKAGGGSSCYLPLGGEGRTKKLLADCLEFLDLLEKYPGDVTGLLTTDYATTKQGLQLNEAKLRRLLKEYK